VQHAVELARAAARLLRSGLAWELIKSIAKRTFGRVVYVSLALEVDAERRAPRRCSSLVVRPFAEHDRADLTSILDDRSQPAAERLHAARRIAMLDTRVRTCLVAEDALHRIVFVIWLIPASESERLQRTFGDWLPTLGPGEALLKDVYVFPRHRAATVFPCAVELVIEQAARSGVVRLRTMIEATNNGSLAAFSRLGFNAYQIRVEKRRLLSRRRDVIPIVADEDVLGLRSCLSEEAVATLLRARRRIAERSQGQPGPVPPSP
jgi:hypothetical protein